MTAVSPVIVIGAHRSGTSALVRVLADLGVLTGHGRDHNEEAFFFLRLNEWLLARSGGRWDHPEPVRALIQNPELATLVADYLRVTVDSPRAAGYLGLAGWLRHRSLLRIESAWCFKDPRTTFTLPLWLAVFPAARVIHIHRDGVDVASSLHHRHTVGAANSRRRYLRNRPLFRWLGKRAGFCDSPRCATLDGALSLWQDYVHEARRQLAPLGERALEISYEDLVLDPVSTVGRVREFCALPAVAGALERAAARMDPSRARAHERSPELHRFADGVAERVAAVRRGDEPQPVPVPRYQRGNSISEYNG